MTPRWPWHEIWRRRVSLLAAGASEGSERAETLAHLEGCPSCREEYRTLEATLALLAEDPARRAEPPIPVGALRARVEARLASAEERGGGARVSRWVPRAMAAAALVTLAVVALYRGPETQPTASERAASATSVEMPDEVWRRLESNAVRAQAARYLNEAQDVILTVAAAPQRCPKGSDRLDVEAEAQRSRELLARRALLEVDRAEVAAARVVLDDVERVLREVASLEACARKGDVQAIHRDVRERRLLMKIDLLTRELMG